MKENELLNKALDFIVETQEQNDYICEQMCEEYVGDYCAQNCQNLNKECVKLFLQKVYKKDEKQGEQKHVAKYKVGDTIYYSSFGRLVSFVIANIVEDGTDNPMYEDKDGNSVFEKDLVEQKHAEWSEYDEELTQAKKDAYNDALDKIEYHSGEPTFDDGWSAAIWYLKKRNAHIQSTWKPSDEQITWLYRAADEASKDSRMKQILNGLLSDLKKLREE